MSHNLEVISGKMALDCLALVELCHAWGEDFPSLSSSEVVLSLKNLELLQELVLEATNEHKHV